MQQHYHTPQSYDPVMRLVYYRVEEMQRQAARARLVRSAREHARPTRPHAPTPAQRAIGAIRSLLGGGARRGCTERPVPLAVPET